MKKQIAAACSVLTLMGATIAGTSPAAAQPWRHHHYGHGRHWRRHGYRHHDHGAALAAGALGFVLGAAIADSAAHQSYARSHLHDSAWLNHCEAKYKSFNAASGTYLGYDGKRHYCQ